MRLWRIKQCTIKINIFTNILSSYKGNIHININESAVGKDNVLIFDLVMDTTTTLFQMMVYPNLRTGCIMGKAVTKNGYEKVSLN